MLIIKRPFITIFMILPLLAISCKDKPINNETVDTNPTKEETLSTKTEKNKEGKVILFFGDSLTAGFGLNEEESFPTLIQDRIDSLDMAYRVVNAGLSGETSSNGKARINWVLQNPVDIFILELGANDMLRGLDLSATKENLSEILSTVQEKYPKAEIIVFGMQSPPNMGPDYVNNFSQLFEDLAKTYDAGYLPFFLDGVAGIPDLNLPDGKHPNAEGQKIVMENVWEVLKAYL